MRARMIAIAAAATLAAAGCGDDGGDGGADTTAREADTTQTTTADGDDAAGDVDAAQLFSQYCSGCHGAEGVGGNVGPSLQEPSLADNPDAVERQIREGGGAMPAFEDQLSDEQIEALTEYVTDELATQE